METTPSRSNQSRLDNRERNPPKTWKRLDSQPTPPQAPEILISLLSPLKTHSLPKFAGTIPLPFTFQQTSLLPVRGETTKQVLIYLGASQIYISTISSIQRTCWSGHMLTVFYFMSTQYVGKIVRITKQDNIEFKDLKGFVTAMYDRNWWLGCVLDKSPDSEEIKVTLLEPKGLSPSFYYPSHPDILVLKYSDVLSLVDPITYTGRTYKLSKIEMENVSNISAKKIS